MIDYGFESLLMTFCWTCQQYMVYLPNTSFPWQNMARNLPTYKPEFFYIVLKVHCLITSKLYNSCSFKATPWKVKLECHFLFIHIYLFNFVTYCINVTFCNLNTCSFKQIHPGMICNLGHFLKKLRFYVLADFSIIIPCTSSHSWSAQYVVFEKYPSLIHIHYIIPY